MQHSDIVHACTIEIMLISHLSQLHVKEEGIAISQGNKANLQPFLDY